MSFTRWIYTLCFIAFATIATVSLIFAILNYRSNEYELAEISKLRNITSHFEATKTKLEELEFQTKLNEEFRKITVKNCNQLENFDVQKSGVYNITVGKKITKVYCDMETDGGGWTVIQRRISDATDFYREWSSYVIGFGNLTGNFWLGLDNIHLITSSGSYQLRVDLQDFSSNQAHALYSYFSIGSESSNYRLDVSGYSGNAGNSLSYNNNQPFSTKDRDNGPGLLGNLSCPVSYRGGWWYTICAFTNLNGIYYSSGVEEWDGVTWYYWKDIPESLKRVEMKIKPN